MEIADTEVIDTIITIATTIPELDRIINSLQSTRTLPDQEHPHNILIKDLIKVRDSANTSAVNYHKNLLKRCIQERV